MKDHYPTTLKPLAIAVAIAAGVAPLAPAWAAAGKVAFAIGDVTIENPGGARSGIKRGAVLESGDTVVTGRGRAQLRFTDGSFVSLQPESSFQIEDYNYETKEQSNDRSVFNLFRGGLRTITGLIGKRSRGVYRVNTPVATIGIRGTAYTMALQPDGALALECADGTIFAANDGGTTFFNAGEVGVVLNQFTVPQLVQGESGEQLLVLSPPARELNEEQIPIIGDDGDTDTVTINITGLDADGVKQTLLDSGLNEEQACALVSEVFPDFVIPETVVEDEVVVVPPVLLIDDGTGMAVASAFYCHTGCEGAPYLEVEPQVSTDFITGTGQLESWTNEIDDELSARGELAFADTGADEVIAWGRWTFSGGGTFPRRDDPASDFFGAEESLHYVVGRPTDLLALSGAPHNGHFSTIGYTTPTSKDGTTGAFVSAAAFVDFGTNTVDGQVKYDFQGATYDVRFASLTTVAPGEVGTFSGSSFAPDNISATSAGACVTGCDTSVRGIVAGDNAERLGFVYHVKDAYVGTAKGQQFGSVALTQDDGGPLPQAPAVP